MLRYSKNFVPLYNNNNKIVAMTRTEKNRKGWLGVALAMVVLLGSCGDKEVPRDEEYINRHVVEGVYQGQWTLDGTVISTIDLTVTESDISFSVLPIEYLVQLVREANNGAPAENQPVVSIEKGAYHCYYHEETDKDTGEHKNYFMNIMILAWLDIGHLLCDISINGNPFRIDVAVDYPSAGLLGEDGSLTFPFNIQSVVIADYQTLETYVYNPQDPEVRPKLKLECKNIKMK